MFCCHVCHSQFQFITDLLEHKKNLKHKQSNEKLVDDLGDIGFRKTIQKRIMTSSYSLENRLKTYSSELPTDPLSMGGKHKSFDPKSALVYAKTPGAMKDFTKENNMKEALNQLLTKDNMHIRDLFFSFQNEIESESTFSFVRYRRVSLYEKANISSCLPEQASNDSSLYGYYEILKKSVSFLNVIENNIYELKKFIAQIIHQIIYIHYCLYTLNLQHGDMHMGNIKLVIDNLGFPIIKAFDFGKARFLEEQARNDKLKDLSYLLQREAVSGKLETFKRNIVRAEDSSAQQKHYPIHKLLGLLIKPKEITNRNTLNLFIAMLGSGLTGMLKEKTNSVEKNANILTVFEELSNELVAILF